MALRDKASDFVTEEDFKWAVNEATNKKKQDFSKVEFLTIEEGLCVQCMHIGGLTMMSLPRLSG